MKFIRIVTKEDTFYINPANIAYFIGTETESVITFTFNEGSNSQRYPHKLPIPIGTDKLLNLINEAK